MKTTTRIITAITFLFLTAYVFQACKKASTTPAATVCSQKNLTATADGSSYTSCTCSASNNGTYISISSVDGGTGPALHQIYIDVPTAAPIVGTPYVLGTGFGIGEYSVGSPTAAIYQTNTTNLGTITITKYDATNRLMSGTFSFPCVPASSSASGTKNVTGGTFTDVKF
jgi:hypothetical protein